MRDVHIRVDDQLADAARSGAGVSAAVGTAALIRLALAKLAGWPDAAASYAAGTGSFLADPRQVTWERETCSGCGRPVNFLPRQETNRCGWCGVVIVRGLE